MIATSGKKLKCVVVTPERAVLDETVEFVVLPMYDGEIGVLPGRAPLIGRLGYGEMRLQRSGTTESYFLDGGFAQIRSDVVTVLTDRAIAAADIDAQAAARQLTTAIARIPKNAAEQAARENDELRARAQVRIANKLRNA